MRSALHALCPIALLPLVWSVGCAPSPLGPRAAFIQEVLVNDNRVWLSDEPWLVEDKFAIMAADPYDFMRGSAALHFADLARAAQDRPHTRFLQSPAASTVLIFGDPHPENATVCRADPTDEEPDPRPTVELVDLDASGFGPWTLDLRRAALGLAMLSTGLEGCEASCRAGAIEALAEGYADVIAGGDSADQGDIFADLRNESRTEGAALQRTEVYAPLNARGGRTMALGTANGLDALSTEERLVLSQILSEMPLPADFRMLDAARRYGSGVTSRPALRFVVAWDRGDPSPEDDALLSFREVADPPVFPGRAVARSAAFENNGQRVALAAERLWSRPDADPRSGWAPAGGMQFKALSWTSWFQDIDHIKLQADWDDGSIEEEDLWDLGEDLGRTLAGSHGRARTFAGDDAQHVILTDLRAGGGKARLTDELLRDMAADLPRTLGDHALFRDLLRTEGPLLGADLIVSGVPL